MVNLAFCREQGSGCGYIKTETIYPLINGAQSDLEVAKNTFVGSNGAGSGGEEFIEVRGFPPSRQKKGAKMGHGAV
jgi:hypothetical protein